MHLFSGKKKKPYLFKVTLVGKSVSHRPTTLFPYFQKDAVFIKCCKDFFSDNNSV